MGSSSALCRLINHILQFSRSRLLGTPNTEPHSLEIPFIDCANPGGTRHKLTSSFIAEQDDIRPVFVTIFVTIRTGCHGCRSCMVSAASLAMASVRRATPSF